MPGKPTTAKSTTAKRSGVEPEAEIEDDFLSDEDYFLEELRTAVARARSSSIGGLDLHDGPWGGGFDRLQVEFGD